MDILIILHVTGERVGQITRCEALKLRERALFSNHRACAQLLQGVLRQVEQRAEHGFRVFAE